MIIEDMGIDGIPYRQMLRMLDRWSNRMEFKGGSVEFSPKKIWITSNIHPRDWYPQDEVADGWGKGPLARRIDTIVHMGIIYVPPKLSSEPGPSGV